MYRSVFCNWCGKEFGHDHGYYGYGGMSDGWSMCGFGEPRHPCEPTHERQWGIEQDKWDYAATDGWPPGSNTPCARRRRHLGLPY